MFYKSFGQRDFFERSFSERHTFNYGETQGQCEIHEYGPLQPKHFLDLSSVSERNI